MKLLSAGLGVCRWSACTRHGSLLTVLVPLLVSIRGDVRDLRAETAAIRRDLQALAERVARIEARWARLPAPGAPPTAPRRRRPARRRPPREHAALASGWPRLVSTSCGLSDIAPGRVATVRSPPRLLLVAV